MLIGHPRATSLIQGGWAYRPGGCPTWRVLSEMTGYHQRGVCTGEVWLLFAVAVAVGVVDEVIVVIVVVVVVVVAVYRGGSFRKRRAPRDCTVATEALGAYSSAF